MAVASLTVTKTYADGLAWTEARMDTAMQSVQTYTQTSLVNNFNQLRKDIWGATYSLDNDGNANLTNTLYKDAWGRSWTADAPKTNSLYNKQTLTCSNASVVVLATGNNSWSLTTSALTMAFTPEATGKYEITYSFFHEAAWDDSGNCKTLFAIYNQTAAATLMGVASELSGGALGSGDINFSHPITLSYIHTFSSTAAATFVLRYRVTDSQTMNKNRLGYTATIGRTQFGSIQKI